MLKHVEHPGVWSEHASCIEEQGDAHEVTNTNQYKAQFQQQAQYPVLEHGQNSCDDSAPAHALFHSMPTATSPRTLTGLAEQALSDVNQAGSKAVIYDQNGNAAIYEVRFTPDLCDLARLQSSPYYPSGTTTLKFAWRILDGATAEEQKKYFLIQHEVADLGEKRGEHTNGKWVLTNRVAKSSSQIWYQCKAYNYNQGDRGIFSSVIGSNVDHLCAWKKNVILFPHYFLVCSKITSEGNTRLHVNSMIS